MTGTGTRRRRQLAAATFLIMLIAAAPGCTESTSQPDPSPRANSDPRVHLANPRTLADGPIRLKVDGLAPGAAVTVTADSGARGPRGSAEATFVAGEDGRVDLSTDAPRSGDYTGASAYGLLWAMRGGLPRNLNLTVMGLDITVAVDGEVVETLTQRRDLRSDRVRVRRLTVARDGLRGFYFAPPGLDSSDSRAGVVLFGGSEGGVTPVAEAQLLASHGYPALVIGYFRAPGLPRRLIRIPLEYHASALAWLADRPGVDPDRVVPYGVSRGGEAALILASLRPDLAAGAIALVPIGVIAASPADPYRPAWTWRGKPLPYVSTSRQMDRDPGDAVIPVWRIDGPLLLVCGRADRVWPSCHQINDIVDRLAARERPLPQVAAYPEVGHEIGFLVPGIPVRPGGAGAYPDPTGMARPDGWARVLDYLRDLESCRARSSLTSGFQSPGDWKLDACPAWPPAPRTTGQCITTCPAGRRLEPDRS